jgi:O-antigen/teichoic acid export membrane protein
MNEASKPRLMKVAGNTGLVAFGTGLGQLFILASTPFLTRYFSPVEFGQLALLVTLSNIVVAVGCFRFDMALPGCREEEAFPLFALCGLIGISLGLLAFLTAFLPWTRWFHHPILHLIASPGIMLLLIAGVAAFQASCAFLIREGRFVFLSFLRASQGGLFSAFALLTFLGLLWPHILSFALGGLLVAGIVLWGNRKQLMGLDIRTLARTAGTFKKFPSYILPGTLMDVLGCSASVWIVSSVYGMWDAGQYSQMQRLIGAPMVLGSMSLAQVMLKQTADEVREGRPLWPLIRNVGGLLALLSLGLLILLFIVGPPGLRLVLGARWRVDRFFVCLIAATVFLRASVSSLSSVFITAHRFRPAFIWQTCYFLSTMIVLRWCAGRVGFDTFIVCYAIHEFIHYTIYFLLIRKVAKG